MISYMMNISFIKLLFVATFYSDFHFVSLGTATTPFHDVFTLSKDMILYFLLLSLKVINELRFLLLFKAFLLCLFATCFKFLVYQYQ